MNKILIIDDEELTRNTFSEILREYHFSTLEACDGRSGIGIFEKEMPDAVLLDLIMPGMDGIETMQEMRKIDPDVPIIFVTAHGDIPTAVEAVKMGAYDFIVKPPDYKMLVHAVNRAVEQLRLKRDNAAVGVQLLETEAANRQLKREIADRLRAEEALRESGKRLRLQFNSMPIGCILLDPDLMILDWNPAAERIFGFKKEEIVGKSPVGLIVRDSVRPFVETFMKDLKQGNHTIAGVNENITKDGSSITCQWHDTPVRDASGSLIGIMATAEDITERKEMERALRESEAHYRAIIDSFDGLIYECSHDYRVEYMNAKFIRRTGRNAVGELCYNVMHDRDSVCPWCVNDRVFRGETVRWEVQSPKDNRWYYCINTPIRHADGSMSKQAMIIDITERKFAEKALKESENTYRAMFENTGAATVLFGEDGTISHANNKFEVLSGYSKEEIEGRKNWREFVAERDIERMDGYNRLRKIDPQAAPKSYEFHFIDRLDRIKDIALEVDVIPGTKKVVASLVDITERERVETLVRIQRDLALALSALSSLREGLGHCLDAAIQASGMDCGGIYLVDTATGSINLYSSKGLSDEFVENVSHLEADSQKARIIMAGRPLYAPYQDLHPFISETELREGLRFLAVVPFGKHGRVMGCLNVSSHVLDDAPAYAREAIETIAVQIGTVIDRLQAANALQESEERLRLQFNSMPIGCMLLDADLVILDWNPAAESIFGFKKEEIVGKSPVGLIVRDSVRPFVETFMKDLKQGNHTIAGVNQNITKDGSSIACRWHDTPVRDASGRLIGIMCMAEDITERKLAEAALKRYAWRLKALSRRLVAIQETERRHVARELHDEIGQALTGIKLNLEAHSAFPGKTTRKSLDEAQKMVSDLMDRVRTMSLSLRPSMLDDLGLLPALLWHLKKYTAQTNIHVTFKHNCLDCRFEPEVETAVYRAVQEALTNVARHASTNKAEVLLMLENDTLEICVQDSGKGFDPGAALARRDTAGLSGMRERTELLGGQMTIGSAPGAGTSLTVRIPLRERSPQQPSEDA